MIVESWLAEASGKHNRPRVFGLYTMVILGASTAGQLSLPLADTGTLFFLLIAAMLYSLSLVPTAVSSTRAPQPLLRTKIDLRGLWKNSPLAVPGAFLVGVSNGSFGTLSAVYASELSLTLVTTSLFASITILAGAASQMPIVWLSDRFDRRWVLFAIAVVTMCTDLVFILSPPSSGNLTILMGAVLGAAIFAMCPVLVAHANDHAAPEDALLTSGALLMVLGVGSMLGPTIGGALMNSIGEAGLFNTTLLAHTVLVAATPWRIAQREPVDPMEKQQFQMQAPSTVTTRQTTVILKPDELPDR
jgi:MFS family permease